MRFLSRKKTAVQESKPKLQPKAIDSAYQFELKTRLLKELGGGYSSSLGINLANMKSEEVFKWYLASILLGTEIDKAVALQTYKEFEQSNATSPKMILKIERTGLCDILNRGGYIKDADKTAKRIFEAVSNLEKKYEGDLNRLHFLAKNETDLKKKVKALKKHNNQASMDIFLNELRGIWGKVKPSLKNETLLAMKNMGLIESMNPSVALEELEKSWEDRDDFGGILYDFEAALYRLGSEYCSENRCTVCPVQLHCKVNGNKNVDKESCS